MPILLNKILWDNTYPKKKFSFNNKDIAYERDTEYKILFSLVLTIIANY